MRLDLCERLLTLWCERDNPQQRAAVKHEHGLAEHAFKCSDQPESQRDDRERDDAVSEGDDHSQKLLARNFKK
jgi:hypothetical protein